VLQQLNAELARSPGEKPPSLTEANLRFVREQFRLNEEESNEVGSASYTLLDGHYLDQCFLLRDAVQSLQLDGLPEEERVAAAFAWVVRQVRLVETNEEPAPPAAILRRGWGNDSERSLVFLAMLEQLDIPGCMIAVAGPGGQRLWIPGALVNNNILLFDTRLGVPLPGTNGREIATLGQARSRPEILQQLRPFDYDVTPEQVRRSVILIGCSLSALAPRQGRLQQILASTNPVRLSQDPQALLQKFRHAILEQALAGTPVQFWRVPTHALRAFLPPEEGGGDATRDRQRRFVESLVPWQLVPKQVADLQHVDTIPEQIELRTRLHDMFARPFVAFSPLADPKQPRELMLHGRQNEAVKGLVEQLDKWHSFQAEARADPELDKEFAQWFQQAVKTQGDFLIAQRQASIRNSPESRETFKSAQANLESVWKDDKKARVFMSNAAATPFCSEATYLLALAKHEQAEQTQARLKMAADKPEAPDKATRDAWQSAAEWWQNYLEDNPSGPAEIASRLSRARALEALGQREAAKAVLESAKALQGWNQRAVLYRLQQLKAP
jgi:hypothetical protein